MVADINLVLRNHTILLEPESFFAMRHERKDLGPRHGRRWLTAIAIGALALSPVVVGADQSPALAATDWSQLGLDIDGEAGNDGSGHSVSLSDDGTRVAIGAHGIDGGDGHVRVYSWNGTKWNQLGDDIDGEAANDRSGYSVSLSGDGSRVAIGAPWNDGASLDPTNNAGHVRIYTVAATITSETASGTPGIFLHITGPVGRSVAGSPVYYGADRVQVTSTYTLTLTPVGGKRPPVTMLAEGTIELNGSFSTSVRLDPLAPGSYDVQFTGTHRNGATLELTSRIVVGPGGEYMLIGDNIPIIR